LGPGKKLSGGKAGRGGVGGAGERAVTGIDVNRLCAPLSHCPKTQPTGHVQASTSLFGDAVQGAWLRLSLHAASGVDLSIFTVCTFRMASCPIPFCPSCPARTRGSLWELQEASGCPHRTQHSPYRTSQQIWVGLRSTPCTPPHDPTLTQMLSVRRPTLTRAGRTKNAEARVAWGTGRGGVLLANRTGSCQAVKVRQRCLFPFPFWTPIRVDQGTPWRVRHARA
jgi:hypothetical protein